jgi:Methylpurine-DNA glycosylase (MPG)
VLIRSCEPVSGHALITQRRAGIEGPLSLTGPGKIGAALALGSANSGQPLFDASGPLTVLDAPVPARWLAGPRVGIGYASPEHQSVAWRFALADSSWVSQRKTLKLVGAESREHGAQLADDCCAPDLVVRREPSSRSVVVRREPSSRSVRTRSKRS